MGQGEKRKPGDQPRLKKPKKVLLPATGIGGSSASGAAANEPIVCPVNFQVSVNPGFLVVEGISVDLKADGSRFWILIGSTTIGRLDAKHSLMVTNCGAQGIRYKGKIVILQKKPYAKFQRIG